MRRAAHLFGEAWVAGQAIQGDFRALQAEAGNDSLRVEALLIKARLDIDAGTSDVETEDLLDWIGRIHISGAGTDLVNAGSYALHILAGACKGALPMGALPAAVTAMATGAIRHVQIPVFFRLPQDSEADDGLVEVAELIRDGQIRITTSAAAIGATGTVNEAFYEVSSSLVRDPDVELASLPRIVEYTQDLDDDLPPGVYSHAVLFNKGGFAAAALTGVTMRIPGDTIYAGADPDQILDHARLNCAYVDPFGGDLATIEDTPADVRALPLILPHFRGKRTRVLDSSRGRITYNLIGNNVAYNWIVRQSVPLTATEGRARMEAIGIDPTAVTAEVVTASKQTPSAAAVANNPALRTVPVRLRPSAGATAGRLGAVANRASMTRPAAASGPKLNLPLRRI